MDEGINANVKLRLSLILPSTQITWRCTQMKMLAAVY